MRSTKSAAIIKCLDNHFARYGVPGPNFDSECNAEPKPSTPGEVLKPETMDQGREGTVMSAPRRSGRGSRPPKL